MENSLTESRRKKKEADIKKEVFDLKTPFVF